MKADTKRQLKTVTVKQFIDDYIYRIDLDADYQREKIWTRENQELLLDSIVENIDIPKLYLAKTKDNESFDYECIDGKQRMITLQEFLKPDPTEESPLTVRIAGEKYTYKKLRMELPKLAKKIEDYELTFVIYTKIDDDEFLRKIFIRLQLGIRLNSGEMLNAHVGDLHDFVFKEMGSDAPFLKHTRLSEKRYSRQFTLAQICINSFSRAKTSEFIRARYDDLEDFFKEQEKLNKHDENLVRIRKVLALMNRGFGKDAQVISSRAVAVSAYLFVEELYLRKKSLLIPRFAKFFVKLLVVINENLMLLRKYEGPTNRYVLEEFQKHISQASVEPYAIKRRHDFIEKAFKYYLNSKTKGEIVRD
jgi:hypothetical protein